ncbi:MAG TPA: serine/threonine-protein kinase [Saprospiraceae bacterium]|nr:serine/threonine-protein kinase [Saprospiraceae bacterium]HMQ82307.1 serine/threonine-protein kinase [Saprospiraceae bacterium]
MNCYPHDPNQVFRHGWRSAIFIGTNALTGQRIAIKRCEVRKWTNKYSVLSEFKLAKKLKHPNIIECYDVFRVRTSLGKFDYGIMEFVENGFHLDDFMATKPSLKQINTLLIGVLNGLDYLHQNGIVHRDMKPQNILIKYDQGDITPKIIDFEISKRFVPDQTGTSAIIGTSDYMSPEQLGNHQGKIGPYTDIWGFGVILYRMFTGLNPFGSVTMGQPEKQIQAKILDDTAIAVPEFIDPPYAFIIQKCLAKKPAERFQQTPEIVSYLMENSL